MVCLLLLQLVVGPTWLWAETPPATQTPNTTDVDTVHTYTLALGVTASVLADGSIHLRLPGEDGDQGLLEVIPHTGGMRRASVEAALFTGVFTEGAVGGLRGFARDADDDKDGLVDEDRADGVDNDGDGLVDEDFAAVSDAMVVVHRTQASRQLHLETYQWSYSHLRSCLALVYRHTDGAGRGREGSVILTLPTSLWYRTVLSRGASHQSTLYVVSLRNPADPEVSLWLGVLPLTTENRAVALHRARLSDEILQIPLVDGRAQLAVAVASSPLKLRYDLERMRAVQQGAFDLTGHTRVEWIVPSASLAYRVARNPSVRVEALDAEGMQLVFQIASGENGAFDPDRFRWNDQPLHSPRTITWRDQENPDHDVRTRWSAWSATDLERLTEVEQDPYRFLPQLLDHTAAGELVFEYLRQPDAADRDEGVVLTGENLCGRSFRTKLDPLPEARESGPAGGPAGGPEAVASATENTSAAAVNDPELRMELRPSGQPPTLNPGLLENFPNPFRDQTRIRYRIPETVQEGFVWRDGTQPDLEADTRIPYQSSLPAMSLKVYSLNGHEIATLFDGSQGIGHYEAVWDGTDIMGRTVASGTYFCKLQVEEWSVTKRLIFLR